MAVNGNTRGVSLTPNKTHSFQRPISTLLASPFLDSYVLQLLHSPCHGLPRVRDRPGRPFQVRRNSFVVTAHVQSAAAAFWYELLTMARLYRFYTSGMFADFEICCHGHVFKVHKIVICASSKYFEALCGGSFWVRTFWIQRLIIDSLIALSRKRPRSP
jgi:hypothetical protein